MGIPIYDSIYGFLLFPITLKAPNPPRSTTFLPSSLTISYNLLLIWVGATPLSDTFSFYLPCIAKSLISDVECWMW